MNGTFEMRCAILRPIVKRARSDEEKAWHRPNQYPESLMSKR